MKPSETTPRRGQQPAILHLIHLPDQVSPDAHGDHAGLHLAKRTAATLPGQHLIVAINSAARLDRLCPGQLQSEIEFGCITPPRGKLSQSVRSVIEIVARWRPRSVVLWHESLAEVGHALGSRHAGLMIIEGWKAPTGAPDSSSSLPLPPDREIDTLAVPTSAMARLLAREQLGIAGDDERPLVTLLPNVPASADAWWFSVIVSMLESAQVPMIGAIPALSRQRSRGRRFRHVSGLQTPVIEHDHPLTLLIAASDAVIGVARDSDRDVELEETVTLASRESSLNRIVICQSLAHAVPTVVAPAHASIVPTGLRSTLVADSTRASMIASCLHSVLKSNDALAETRRVLTGSVIPCPDAEIVAWVQDRIALRDLDSRREAMAGAR
ncbi:MAG: hypothetical protein KGS45_04275 [Planctomycetes bacterium]|nr:hypothetical protein [Planctomycetota bacterium]